MTPGRILDGRYRLERILAAGGMGGVYEALDLRLERRVAVKIIPGGSSEAAGRRFLREARALAAIRSPHVVAVHDYGEEGGEVFLVEELLFGITLDALLRGQGPLDPRWAVRLGVEACKGLSSIHRLGFVHRDIKLSNLMLAASEDGSERLVVLDLGIAKRIEKQATTQVTPTGIVVGTPAYMAPELLLSDREPSTRADLYSLGSTLFELITGEPPFVAPTVMAMLKRLVDEAPRSLPADRASPELDAIVLCCLAKAPEDRYASAADLMEALLATPHARAEYTPPPTTPPRRSTLPPEKPNPAPISIQYTEPAPPPSPCPELEAYLAQAGLKIGAPRGSLLPIERTAECPLPLVQLWAIVLEPENQPLAMRTMATQVFQKDALALYALEATAASPHHVLAVLRNPPGAGVYREWHKLATRKHVHISPISPSGLRTATEANRALSHLQELLRRGRRDPFELEGRIANDLDFFGGRDDLQAFLHLIDGASAGIGLFGLEKWGTTSLLFRARDELSDRFSAWIDLAALPSLSLADLYAAVHEELSNGLSSRGHTQPTPLAEYQGDAESAVLDVLAACQSASQARPVVFLDRVDELGHRERCSPDTLLAIARALYRLAFPRGGRAGAILVFGGREANLLSSRTLAGQDNPLWGAVSVRYASFFSREEMGDCMQRLGALGGLSFTYEALDKAFDLTFGHKYLSRKLGSLLYQRGPLFANGSSEVTPSRVATCAVPLITQNHHYFESILRRGPPGLRHVLTRIARGPCTVEELFAHEDVRASGDPLRALEFASAYRLAREEQGLYQLTMGLLEAWLRFTQESSRSSGPEPTAKPSPTANEIQGLEALIREGFSSSTDLELLAWHMQVPLASMVRLAMPLPNQIVDLVKWAVDHRRFWDLREAVRRERPNFFSKSD